MTEAELAKIEARAQAATPGPFYWVSLGRGTCDSPCIALDGREATRADQYLFAKAQSDIVALATEVRRLRSDLQEAKKQLRWCEDREREWDGCCRGCGSPTAHESHCPLIG